MKLRITSLAAAVIVLAACSPKVVPPVSEPAPPPAPPARTNALTPELAEGKTLYENNCIKCHRLYDRREYEAQEWRPILKSMQANAGITDAETEKIYNYLTMN